MNFFKIWIYGTKTNISYFISLTDKWNERYRYWITDDWEGWKEVSIFLDYFTFSTSGQPANAKINHVKDYPLMSVDIEMNSQRASSTGSFKLIIGGVEVTR